MGLHDDHGPVHRIVQAEAEPTVAVAFYTNRRALPRSSASELKGPTARAGIAE